MSLEFRLTLATEIPIDQVAGLAIADPEQRPAPTEFSDQLLSADLYQECGFALSIRAGRDGYYDAASEDGSSWEWEPARYVDLTFSMGKDDLTEKGMPEMLGIVWRVLQGTTEDAALVQDGNYLYLTRTGGILRKHRRTEFWDGYDFANEIIPG